MPPLLISARKLYTFKISYYNKLRECLKVVKISLIPSSSEMKYEPAFKPLQRNPALIESGHLVVHST